MRGRFDVMEKLRDENDNLREELEAAGAREAQWEEMYNNVLALGGAQSYDRRPRPRHQGDYPRRPHNLQPGGHPQHVQDPFFPHIPRPQPQWQSGYPSPAPSGYPFIYRQGLK